MCSIWGYTIALLASLAGIDPITKMDIRYTPCGYCRGCVAPISVNLYHSNFFIGLVFIGRMEKNMKYRLFLVYELWICSRRSRLKHIERTR